MDLVINIPTSGIGGWGGGSPRYQLYDQSLNEYTSDAVTSSEVVFILKKYITFATITYTRTEKGLDGLKIQFRTLA